MKWSEIKRIATSKGFELRKNGKKHDQYYNPKTGQMILVERHWSQEVRPGLLKELKKILGF